MGSDAKKAFNAIGRDELLWFDPETLTIVEDADAALVDPDRTAPPPEWLVQSIMTEGVDTPIIVRLNGKREDGTPIVEVVNGRQRVRSAREANKRLRKAGAADDDMIRVQGIRTRGDDVALLGKMIRTNELIVPTTPLARARLAQRYMAKGRSVSETAAQFGVKDVTIKAWLDLLELDGSVQRAVEKGELPPTTAAKMADLPREEQKVALEKMRADGALKGKSGREAVARAKGKERGRTEPEAGGAVIPSRVWLKRLLAELEANLAEHPAEEEVKGGVAVLRLVLEGKKPRASVIADSWRAVQKRFVRSNGTAEAEE